MLSRPASKTTRSWLPFPQLITSLIPSTASTRSSPLPACSPSLPELPATTSSASPPFTVSSLLPPLSLSLPPSPSTESARPFPRIRSAPLKPYMVSRWELPYMVSLLLVPRHLPPSQFIVRARATPLARTNTTAKTASKRTDLLTLQAPSLRGTEPPAPVSAFRAVYRRDVMQRTSNR